MLPTPNLAQGPHGHFDHSSMVVLSALRKAHKDDSLIDHLNSFDCCVKQDRTSVKHASSTLNWLWVMLVVLAGQSGNVPPGRPLHHLRTIYRDLHGGHDAEDLVKLQRLDAVCNALHLTAWQGEKIWIAPHEGTHLVRRDLQAAAC